MIYTLYSLDDHGMYSIINLNLNFVYKEEEHHSIEFLDAMNQKGMFLEHDQEQKKYEKQFDSVEQLEKFLKRKCRLKFMNGIK